MIDVDGGWSLPPLALALGEGEVHIWRAFLHQVDERVHQLAQLLSEDEVARAQRFRFERDRRRFIVARGVLRSILGRYLFTEPKQIRFQYYSQGKPAIDQGQSSVPLFFNLAHSHEMALYVFTRQGEIGIDLEHIRPLPGFREIAARFFTPGEYEDLCKLDEKLQMLAFYNCWTRKEAYLKALGDGLMRPLDEFEVSLIPGEPARLLRVQHDQLVMRRWSLVGFAPALDYVAALAVEGQDWIATCWQWT